jgi:hypothetical protein
MSDVDIQQEVVSLRRAFTVDRIMTAAKRLKRATRESTAFPLFQYYDVVPFPFRGRIKGYFSKNDHTIHDIERADLVGGATSLLDLVGLFKDRQFFFVLYGNDISGLVHFSDLNHSLVRIPVYGLLQLLERTTLDGMSRKLDDDLVKQVLHEEWNRILGRKRSNQMRNLDVGWANILYLPELLRLAIRLGKVQLEVDELADLVELRNKVMHPARRLVASLPDLAKTTDAIKTVRRLLRDN